MKYCTHKTIILYNTHFVSDIIQTYFYSVISHVKNEIVDVLILYYLHLTNKKPIQIESIKVYTIKEKRDYCETCKILEIMLIT